MARDSVADYFSAATMFVSLVDRAETQDSGRLLGDLAIALADLYSAAARLPDPDVASDELLGGRKLSRHTALEGVLGGDDVNWDTIDWRYHDEWLGEPYERKRVVGLLANDLDEAYMDVRDHIAMLESTDRSGDAVWQVRFEFWSHTCNHVIGALRPIHAYLADGGGPIALSDPRYPRRVAPQIDLGRIPRDQVDLRLHVGRHLARVAAANGQDQASAFRSAFTMNYDAAERLWSYVAPVAEEATAPLNDDERRYLEGRAWLE